MGLSYAHIKDYHNLLLGELIEIPASTRKCAVAILKMERNLMAPLSLKGMPLNYSPHKNPQCRRKRSLFQRLSYLQLKIS